MPHKRQEIREALKVALDGVFSDPSHKQIEVYADRYLPIKKGDCVIVYTQGDPEVEKASDEQAYRRIEKVLIRGFFNGVEEHQNPDSHEVVLQDKIDAFCQDVELILNNSYETLADYSLDGEEIIFRLNYTGTSITINVEADPLIGFVDMTYDAIYYDKTNDGQK